VKRVGSFVSVRRKQLGGLRDASGVPEAEADEHGDGARQHVGWDRGS
jgi:hypothetical protein